MPIKRRIAKKLGLPFAQKGGKPRKRLSKGASTAMRRELARRKREIFKRQTPAKVPVSQPPVVKQRRKPQYPAPGTLPPATRAQIAALAAKFKKRK